MRRCLSLLVVFAALLILPTGLQSQQPGGGKGGKGGGGKAGRGPRGAKGNNNGPQAFGGMFDIAGINTATLDPGQIFDALANGKDSIDRSDMQGMQLQMFDRIAQTMNITDGRITKDQFRMAMEAATGRMAMPMVIGADGGAGGGRFTMGANVNVDQIAESLFKRADKNNDGVLSVSEMSDQLKGVWQQFDTNGDGAIDLNEYKAFMKTIMPQAAVGQGNDLAAIMQQFGFQMPAQQSGARGTNLPIDELDARPVVFRAGHLPSDLPSWFDQMDFDKDAQIGLWEWVQAGRTPAEFQMWDRNGDGFVTIEEVLSVMRNMNRSTDSLFASLGGDQRGRGGRGARGGGGGPGGAGGGRNGAFNGMDFMNPGNNPRGRNQDNGAPGAGGPGRGRNNQDGQGGDPNGRGRRGGGGGRRGGGGDNEQ